MLKGLVTATNRAEAEKFAFDLAERYFGNTRFELQMGVAEANAEYLTDITIHGVEGTHLSYVVFEVTFEAKGKVV